MTNELRVVWRALLVGQFLAHLTLDPFSQRFPNAQVGMSFSSSASLFRPTSFSPSYAKRLTSVGVRPYMAISIVWMWSWLTNSISGGSADEKPNLTFPCASTIKGITVSANSARRNYQFFADTDERHASLISPNLNAS